MTGAPDESEWLPKRIETVEYMYGQWKRQTYQEGGVGGQGSDEELQEHRQARMKPS